MNEGKCVPSPDQREQHCKRPEEIKEYIKQQFPAESYYSRTSNINEKIPLYITVSFQKAYC